MRARTRAEKQCVKRQEIIAKSVDGFYLENDFEESDDRQAHAYHR